MNMKELINSLPDQILEMVDQMDNLRRTKRKFSRTVVCGMGGSGISGEIMTALYPQLPIMTNKDYSVPGYLTKDTLAILISYSGNTEETLTNYRTLAQRKIPIVTISSGGKLLQKPSLLKIMVPQGLPPRAALGYLFTPLPFVLYRFGEIKTKPSAELRDLAHFLRRSQAELDRLAQRLAKRFMDRFAIIYGNSALSMVAANRWRCQLNENAKILCHINQIPEMNHNEIVGLGRPRKLNKYLVLVLLSDPKAHPRNKLRWQILRKLTRNELAHAVEITPQGHNHLQRLFWTIMLGDLTSYYLAKKTNVDPLPVKRIDFLKEQLAKAH